MIICHQVIEYLEFELLQTVHFTPLIFTSKQIKGWNGPSWHLIVAFDEKLHIFVVVIFKTLLYFLAHINTWRTKEPLDESESGEWKSWLKSSTFRKLRSWHLVPYFMGNRWGNSVRLYFWGLQNHCRWWLQPWN